MTDASDGVERLVIPPLPASGAWRPGDPVGRRQFFSLPNDRPFALEGGGFLDEVVVAYETWGSLDDDAANAILICHALDGRQSRHWSGRSWPPRTRLVGRHDRPRPADRHRAVLRRLPEHAGRLPGVDGSVVDRARDRPALRLAVPDGDDPRHGARAGGAHTSPRHRQVALRDRRLDGRHAGARVGCHVSHRRAVAASDRSVRAGDRPADRARAASDDGAIRLDPKWRGGDYYDAAPGDGPHEGLAIARQLAQITFRSDDVFTDRFGREMADVQDGFSLWQRFEVERLSRLPRRQARTPLRRELLPRDRQGDGPAGHRAWPRWARSRDGAHPGAGAHDRHPAPTCCTRPTSRSRSETCCSPPVDEPSTWRSTATTAMTSFLIDLDQVGTAVTDFLDDMQKEQDDQ